MKKKQKKINTPMKGAFRYFIDFLVVFAGVFLAFWLNEYKENKNRAEKKKEIYIAIYEELNTFYESGREENKEGFINFFSNLDQRSDSLVAARKLPVKTRIYGDYWKVPIINSFVKSGLLKDIDIETFKKVTRFNTVHQNFLSNISDYNNFYDKYITAEYDQGIDHFYQPGTNELKPKYMYLEDALSGTAGFARLLTNLARDLSAEIKEKHID